MRQVKYSTHAKHTALEKILGPAGQSVGEVSAELGINKRTLYGWIQSAENGDMSKKKGRRGRRKFSFQEKYTAVLESRGLSEEELGRWLRQNGYREEQLKLWEQEIGAALNGIDEGPSRETEKELRELRSELNRKDKALAELSAIIVLKKKLKIFLDETDSEK